MTDPLDLAAIRARWRYNDGDCTNQWTDDTLALCDELDRLHAEVTKLTARNEALCGGEGHFFARSAEVDELVRLRAENAVVRENWDKLCAHRDSLIPVVEAARALVVKAKAEGWIDGDMDEAENALIAAVAAYEAQQGEKP